MRNLSIRKMNGLLKGKKSGFTLVELIIVIAIIAVLAAIAIPKFGAVKADANLRSDQANAKIIATAVASAVADGVTIIDGNISSTSSYIKYIDGGAVPAVKSDTSKTFYITYSSTNGVKVYLGSGGTQVYPVS